MVLSDFNDPISVKIPPGYNKSSMSVDIMRCSTILDCSGTECLQNPETDETHKHLSHFCVRFLFIAQAARTSSRQNGP